MIIGYSAEGSTDRALIEGLRRRWCPNAEIIEGSFRGQTHLSRRREVPNICVQLNEKGADVIIFLTDSNRPNWRDVLNAERERCRPEHAHLTVFGVCLRNIECWLAADPDWIANRFGRERAEFTVDDPKGVVEACFGITRIEKHEDEIVEFVRTAPLHRWIGNPSFEHFFEDLWQKSQQLGCRIENLRDIHG